ncbi:hypothetical protein PR202_ga11925 [Eleusine coracana subsp. coracana]|uniref:Uncharacterized protein n=1 Tax=Eleusine coracana subsp. coracana TaxID=191504 RepID=A0AAV5CAS2_ELECO|nr:hypothetical protein PR202_ga11925 [Eleusine coracana subsp. coracana]
MAMSPSHPMRKYSWWWDSHISPKNSKWLQENLTGKHCWIPDIFQSRSCRPIGKNRNMNYWFA